MNFNYTEDQLAIKDVAERIFRDLCGDEEVKACYEAENPFHETLWKQLVETGLLLAPVREEHGGSGLGMTELCLVMEALGRSVAPVPVLETVVESALPIAEFAPEALRQKILPEVAAGSRILTAVRPYEGLRQLSPLAASKDGEGFELNGHSAMVGYAAVANGFLLNAPDEAGNMVVVYCDASASGVSVTPQKAISGEAAGHIEFSGVKVHAEDVVAKGEKAEELLEWQLQRTYAAMASMQVGVLWEGLRRAAEYTIERKQFGRPLAAFQAVSQQAADAYMAIEALQGVGWRALDDLDNTGTAALSSRVAKFWVCESGHTAAHIFLHLHGGIGQDLDYPLQRFFTWAKKNENYRGAVTQHCVSLGKLIAENPKAVA